jgi:hypothetical protein
MKTIIAGGRDIEDESLVRLAIKQSPGKITEVVCGCARGVDNIGRKLAEQYNIPVALFPANWDLHGPAAGPIRNKQMAEYAHALISIWDGNSKGTLNMITTAKKLGLCLHVLIVGKQDDGSWQAVS